MTPSKPYTIYRSSPAPEDLERWARAQSEEASRARRLAARRTAARRRRRLLTGLFAIGFALTAFATAQFWLPALADLPERVGLSRASASADDDAAVAAGESASLQPRPVTSSPAAAAAKAAPPQPRPVTVTITGGGDVIGDRAVRTLLSFGGGGPLAKIAPLLRKSDAAFVNLETPLTTGGRPQTWKDVVFKGDPRLAAALAKSGVDVVTLANNHAGDQGDRGLLDTLRHCRRSGVRVVGAGPTLAAARSAAVVQGRSARIAFLGFSDVLPMGYVAGASDLGIAPGRADPRGVNRAIRSASAKSDFTVVGWHWNREFTTAPSPLEIRQAKAAIAAGADVVFAHHPHVLQGIQVYRGGLICYSLGDLVFDNCSGPMAETVLVTVTLTRSRLKATLTPVVLASSGQPSVATGARGQAILRRMRGYSAALGTTITIKGGRGYLSAARP